MQKNSPLFGAPAGKRFLAVSVTAALAITGVAFGIGSASAVPTPTATSATPDLSKVGTWEQAAGDHYDFEGTTLPGKSTKALRISNWVDNPVNYGGQQQLKSPPIASAGPRVSGGASYDTFTANFTLSAASYATQPDLSVEVSPNSGENRAGGNLLIREEAGQKLTLTNFHLKPGATTDDDSSWTSSTATIDFTKPVAIKYVAQFDPTASADVVKVYLDGSSTPALTGSTFETYDAIAGIPAQTVNSLLFRAVDRQVGTTTDVPWTIHEPTADEFTALKGKGFYFSAVKYAVSNTAASTPMSFAVPTIDGTAAVGQTLTAVTDTDAVTNVNFAYTWLRNGVAITGATGSSYTTTATDLRSSISVRVTASKPGYTSSTRTSAATARVARGQIAVTTPLTITGTAAVGVKLSAHIVTSPVATHTYQWRANGTAISGATTSEHTLTTADLGKAITVVVVSSKSGYSTLTSTSSATADVGTGTLTIGVPTLSGTAKVGQTLTAKVYATPRALVRYSFFSDGDLVQLSTSPTLLLTWDLAGSTVTVQAAAIKDGYTSITSSLSTGKAVV